MNSNDKVKEQYNSFLENVTEKPKTPRLNDKVLVVDGLNTFIRAFSVNPSINDDGVHIGGLTGFLKSIRYTIDMLKPSRCIIVFDGKDGSKRRRKLYPQYKENRKVKQRLNRNVDWGTAPADEEQAMRMQLGRLVNYLEQLPVTLICVDGTEADDVMGYISKQVLKKSNIILMSTDKDFLQLINNRISVWSPTKKILYNPEKVKKEFGILPNNLLTYRILEGDKSDNIGGIKGAGLKTIVKFIEPITNEEDFSINDLIKYVKNSDKNVKIFENIKDNERILLRNYLLMQLESVDIPNNIKLKIQGALNKEIPQLIKYKFQTLFLKDKLYAQIPDFGSWIKEFVRLDRMKGLNGKKEI